MPSLLALVSALLLLLAPALAGTKEDIAALAPSGLVLLLDDEVGGAYGVGDIRWT